MKSISRFIVLAMFCSVLWGCPVVRGTGNAVQATGDGIGTAVKGVGEGIGDAVEGTGDAIGQTGRELAN